MSTPERKLPGWVLPAGLGLVVVALVVVALARGPVEFDPDSPEGAVQEYLVAIHEERWEDALEVVHDDWRGSCDGDDMRSFDPGDFSAALGAPGGGITRIRDIEGTEATLPEDTTWVEVTINHGDTGGWTEHTEFELVEREGFWWLVGDPWPYFIWSCKEG